MKYWFKREGVKENNTRALLYLGCVYGGNYWEEGKVTKSRDWSPCWQIEM